MKYRIIGVLIGVFMLISSTAWAQMGGGPGMMEKGMMGGGMMGSGMEMHGMGMGMDGGMMEMMKMMEAVSGLDLTPDQKKKIQMLKLSHQKEAIPLFSRVRMSSVEMEELLLQDPVDMTKVKDKIKEKYDAMAKLEVSHLTLKQQIQSILTPEQRQRMESMMMGMKGMM
ncbi:MAG: Spy/CpxP family protein refolding chaperone, partial [Nitrospirae bacterium]|nr:Spy/CpxP family protein refolding chaperone [Nitrospirota bacterium]